MDFFSEQDRARRSTRRLLLLFALAVVSLIVLTNLALAVTLWFVEDAPTGTGDYGAHAPAGFLDYLSMPMFLWIGALVSAAVAIASGVKHVQLARGGAVVAQMLGGEPLDPASQEPAERRLLNVVEEMAIASGVPVPPVYRVPGEGINAFAAGFAPTDAVVGLTDGALARLGRDELQGVIGHEFSHILNGDMRLNLRLIAVLHGIQFLAQAGRLLLDSERGSGSRDKSAGAVLGLGLALMLLGSAGVFFGRLIKAGVSREREFLADASAVQFTRNPLGLADALRRIAALSEHGGVASPRAEEASHLFFAQAIAVRVNSLFATHPPLETRIRRLDPAWDGRIDAMPSPGPAASSDLTAGVAGVTAIAPVFPAGTADAIRIAEASVDSASSRGDTRDEQPVRPEAGHDLPAPLGGLSGGLRAACRGAETAAGVVLGALIDPRAKVADRQYELLAGEGYSMPPGLEAELEHAPLLPVLELARPALAAQDEGQRARLWGAIERLIALDGHLDVRELSAAVMLERHLCPQTGLARATRARYRRLEHVAGSLAVLFSSLACSTPGNSEARFAAAQRAAGLEGLRLLHAPAPDWPALRKALAVLRGVYPLLKPRVLKGCRAALQPGSPDDPDAGTLLALLAGVLDCPAGIVNES